MYNETCLKTEPWIKRNLVYMYKPNFKFFIMSQCRNFFLKYPVLTKQLPTVFQTQKLVTRRFGSDSVHCISLHTLYKKTQHKNIQICTTRSCQVSISRWTGWTPYLSKYRTQSCQHSYIMLSDIIFSVISFTNRRYLASGYNKNDQNIFTQLTTDGEIGYLTSWDRIDSQYAPEMKAK